MVRQLAVLSTHRFTIASIPELVGKLAQHQKALLNIAWDSYVSHGRLFPLRGLTNIFGKLTIKEGFSGLNGSLIYETNEQDGAYFKLTLYGAFLTDHGPALASLIVRLLDLIKDLCKEDSYIKKLNRDQIKDRLELSDSEIQILFRLLTLGLPSGMPLYLSSYAPEGAEWTITINDLEVFELLRSDETLAYMDEHLSEGYRPAEPCSYRERLTYQHRRAGSDSPIVGFDNSAGSLGVKSTSTEDKKQSDLNPWPVVRGFLLNLSSYDVPKIVDRAGLTVDWSLTDKQNYSHKMRLAEYRPRIDTAYQALSNDSDRLRVAYIVTQELAKHGATDELNDALVKIGWELRGGGLAPSNSVVGELFFQEQSQHAAYVEIRAIVQKVTSKIAIIDPYIDQSILTLLSTCAKPGLRVEILTSSLPTDFALEGKKWLSQHAGSSLNVRTTKEFHDRFIILDNSVCWHIGCSIKDAGNKAFMLSELEDRDNREALLAQARKSWDAAMVAL